MAKLQIHNILACAVFLAAIGTPLFFGQSYKSDLPIKHPAIQYFSAPVNDPVARLQRDLENGTSNLESRSDALGYLPSLLKRLDLNTDSQMLVFSKTSFQSPRISPDNPRAIYFNDEVAIGFVRGSDSLELAAIDPIQGPVFYAMNMARPGRPHFERPEVCLRCHQGPNTFGVPGVYIGSVIPGLTGAPLRGESAIITDHRSDFKERWGGWYVNAKRGEQPDRANAVASNPADPETLVRDSQQNLTSLIGKFNPAGYPATLSDIVALMTYEHQTQMSNLITRVGWQARMGQDADIEDLVAYMLFADEAPLKEPIEGVSTFTNTFPQRGPRDKRGRSLRDFDLQKRLFRYPLSYMIYSPAFNALPADTREKIQRRLDEILTGNEYAHLSAADRRAILEILTETRPRN